MDMGDILDKWDKIQKTEKQQKKSQSQTQTPTGKKANADHVAKKSSASGNASPSGETSASRKNASSGTASLNEKSSASKSTSPSISTSEKIARQQKADNERKINPMVVWMNRYGVVDKDKMLDEAAERQKQESHSYLREMRHEAVVDLHGLTAEEAYVKLESFISVCYRDGLRKVLIIHGKGNHSKGSDPVLGKVVRSFIEGDKRLGMSGHPERKDGGSGATWVIIK